MPVPAQPKIYHILHINNLASILTDACLWCDAQAPARRPAGTIIGMDAIKQRRLTELTLTSHPDLNVGECVPFYFCPRSIMLYLIFQGNHVDLAYRGGQTQIIHLQADLHATVAWAQQQRRRWAFTLSNAGAYYFEDRNDLTQLNEINWQAVKATRWQNCKEGKQAEFLLEHSFPWHLVELIGVRSQPVHQQVVNTLTAANHRPVVQVKREWYY